MTQERTDEDVVREQRPKPERYLADHLRHARTRTSYTQDAIAVLTGQPRPVVSNWETGKRVPNIGILGVLAEVYRDDWLKGYIAGVVDTALDRKASFPSEVTP